MAISAVKIGNMALANIGSAATIESFDENSAEAAQINTWYDFSRQQTLEAFDWNFARRRATLTAHGDDAPTTDWSFRYQYPSGALTIRRLVHPSGDIFDAVPYEIELSDNGQTKSIVTDLDNAVAVYTSNTTDPGLFSNLYINALSYLLASYIALPLTGKRQIRGDNLQAYIVSLRMAEANRANEKVDKPPRDTDWIRERA